ncbi:hypothetical protein AB6A40_005139 [Gnathostoma spinigerum]|uniref:Uncharacterized protein n=1 Tax=Gnathostoma spinigerum TaxID=75299 RepID=A0ABD6EFQ0_9BILA
MTAKYQSNKISRNGLVVDDQCSPHRMTRSFIEEMYHSLIYVPQKRDDSMNNQSYLLVINIHEHISSYTGTAAENMDRTEDGDRDFFNNVGILLHW